MVGLRWGVRIKIAKVLFSSSEFYKNCLQYFSIEENNELKHLKSLVSLLPSQEN
jgi:hypothetical protein